MLISCYEDNNGLANDLHSDTGSGHGIICLGINDLKRENLIKEIKNFIN